MVSHFNHFLTSFDLFPRPINSQLCMVINTIETRLTMKNNWMLKKTSWLLLLMIFGVQPHVFASDSNEQEGIFDLLDYREVVNINLTFDQEEVFTDRRSGDEHEATFSFKDEQGVIQDWSIKVSLRGKFRRLKCSEIPPLKLNFSKKDLKKAGLAKFDDFKLVTYCVEDYKAAKDLLLKEYLTYKLYNQITDYSFRVQLVNITYRDSKTGQRKKQMGFLIEDAAQLRARIGAGKSEYKHVIEPERHDLEAQRTTAFFQYLIGNVDWGITHSKKRQICNEGQPGCTCTLRF